MHNVNYILQCVARPRVAHAAGPWASSSLLSGTLALSHHFFNEYFQVLSLISPQALNILILFKWTSSPFYRYFGSPSSQTPPPLAAALMCLLLSWLFVVSSTGSSVWPAPCWCLQSSTLDPALHSTSSPLKSVSPARLLWWISISICSQIPPTRCRPSMSNSTCPQLQATRVLWNFLPCHLLLLMADYL